RHKLSTRGKHTMVIFTRGSRFATLGLAPLFAIWTVSSVLAKQSGFTVIDVPGASALTEAHGANTQGDIVGTYYASDTRTHGFLLSGGAFTTIDGPGAFATEALGINFAGDIVGLYVNATGQHGFLLSKGVLTSIDVPGGSFPAVNGISSGGDIVGS